MNDLRRCQFCHQPASAATMTEADMTFAALTQEIRELRMTIAELRGVGAGRSVVRVLPAALAAPVPAGPAAGRYAPRAG